MSGQSARVAVEIGRFANRAQAYSRIEATPNRTAAIVNGGAASTATAPATHVPPKQIAMAVSIRYATRSLRLVSIRGEACADAPGRVIGRVSRAVRGRPVDSASA